jgi:hypothetical protein
MTEVNTMIEIAELTSGDTLKLPPGIAGHFRPADRFVVWTEGDALYLKRITLHSVIGIVRDAPEGDPLSLDEINDIVHEVRRHSKTG